MSRCGRLEGREDRDKHNERAGEGRVFGAIVLTHALAEVSTREAGRSSTPCCGGDIVRSQFPTSWDVDVMTMPGVMIVGVPGEVEAPRRDSVRPTCDSLR